MNRVTLNSTLNRAAAAALFFCVIGLVLGSIIKPASAEFRRETLTLVLGGGSGAKVPIDIEVAASSEEKSQGLMFRRSLGDRQGMLFEYEGPQEITMWMKNTYIPLDMVFIRTDGTVHRIAAMTEPFSEDVIASMGDAIAVLELNGGAAGRLGLKPGDRIEHAFFKPRAK